MKTATPLPQELRRLVAKPCYATIATVCPDGHPWSTPLYVAFDDTLTMYWASWTENEHSKNLKRDARVHISLFDPSAPEGTAIGLYIAATVRRLETKTEIAAARRYYKTKYGEDGSHSPFLDNCPRRIYAATPLKLWYNYDASINGSFVDAKRNIDIL